MAFDAMLTLEIIDVMAGFLKRKQPPPALRRKVDLDYRIDGQSVIIFEIRPAFNNLNQKIESPFAKATFIKTKRCWKVYWQRANLKWYGYSPKPLVLTIRDFAELVESDLHHFFWG